MRKWLTDDLDSAGPARKRVSEPVLTQLQLTPDNSDPVPTRYVLPHSCSCSPSFLFPLVLVPPSSSFPTPYPSPLYPTSDYASFEGTPIPFRIFSFVLVPLHTMSSLFLTLDALCLSFNYMITLDRVSPLRSSAIYRRAHVNRSPPYALDLF